MIKYAALAGLAAISLLAVPAVAQPPGPPPGMGDMHAMHGAGDSAAMKAKMAEHMAQMDKDMHIILRLRPDQEAAWRAFRDAMHHHGMPGMPGMAMAAPKPGMTTPQRLDEMDKRAAERQALHAKMEAATRAFYAALAPDQQAVFDALHRMHGAGPMMGRKMMMMHGGPGGPSHD